MYNELVKVKTVMDSISEVSSKKDKVEILKNNKDIPLMREVLQVVYNPYNKTNLAKKKINKDVSKIEPELIKSEHIFAFLLQGGGTDKKISTFNHTVEEILSEGHVEKGTDEYTNFFDFMKSIATKSIKIGMTSKSINKAYDEDFIPEFGLMLSYPYQEVKKDKEGNTKLLEHWKKLDRKIVIVTKKLDGNRLVAIKEDNGIVKFYTREGNEVDGLVELSDAFSHLPNGYVYDGEVLAIVEDGVDSLEQFKKTSSIMRSKGEKKGLEFHAFDLIPLDEFKKGESTACTMDRKSKLSKIIMMSVGQNLIKEVMIKYYGVFDIEEIERLSMLAKENKEEGIMVQDADAVYQCKRVYDIQKVKVFQTADLRVKGMYEGENGKTIGTLGGLIVDYKGFDVKVGGGFSDIQRDKIWAEMEFFAGTIVEVQYFEEFDDNGKLDLRFPTFKAIRYDKTEPSYM